MKHGDSGYSLCFRMQWHMFLCSWQFKVVTSWNLWLASVKSMAAVFIAFDHPNYQKLISQHLKDVLTMPAPIITMFQQGTFVVSISGRLWHSVAIDKCHEMLIKTVKHLLLNHSQITSIKLPVTYHTEPSQ